MNRRSEKLKATESNVSRLSIDLNKYCDLTENQVRFLRDPANAHPAARAAFIRDGLMFPDGTLTPDGRKALEVAEEYLSGQRKPEPPLLILNRDAVRFSPDRERGLYAVHLKALLDLALHPGLAWRYMCSLYSRGVMQRLWEENFVVGRPVRGAPQHISWEGLAVLEEGLKRSGVEYYKQQILQDAVLPRGQK